MSWPAVSEAPKITPAVIDLVSRGLAARRARYVLQYSCGEPSEGRDVEPPRTRYGGGRLEVDETVPGRSVGEEKEEGRREKDVEGRTAERSKRTPKIIASSEAIKLS